MYGIIDEKYVSKFFSIELVDENNRFLNVKKYAKIKILKQVKDIKFSDLTDVLYHKYGGCYDHIRMAFRISFDGGGPRFYSYEALFYMFVNWNVG